MEEFSRGKIVKTVSGDEINICRAVGVGGQAKTYLGTKVSTGEQVIVKIFHKGDKKLIELRSNFLVQEQINKISKHLYCFPVDILSAWSYIGHISPVAPGITLDEFLQMRETTLNTTLIDDLIMGLGIARAVELLHKRDIVHGDLSGNNIFVLWQDDVPQISLIDIDNFVTTKFPKNECFGQILYMAPELLRAYHNKTPHRIDKYTESYALGTLLHKILLWKHPIDGVDDEHDPDSFIGAVCAGKWHHGPGCSESLKKIGFSSEILNLEISKLFQRTFVTQSRRTERPRVNDWVKVLTKALKNVYLCDNTLCDTESIIESHKTICPQCQHPFSPTLRLIAQGQSIPINGSRVTIGRRDLGNKLTVSRRHATIRRLGPENYLEAHKPTYRWIQDKGKWIEIKTDTPVRISPGDRFRFADVEVMVTDVSQCVN